MQVLHWNFSEKFDNYLAWYRTASRHEVDFFYTESHPNPAIHSRQAMVEISRKRAHVFINRSINRDLAEENAAHELTHIALVNLGYCYPVVKGMTGGPWQQLANALLTWTADVVIDRKLEDFGYTNHEYKQMVWENTVEHLKLYPRESEPGPEAIFNALGYFYCHHSVNAAQWHEMQAIYQEVDPPVYHLGERIIALGDLHDFHAVEGYCEFLSALSDELGLADKIAIHQG